MNVNLARAVPATLLLISGCIVPATSATSRIPDDRALPKGGVKSSGRTGTPASETKKMVTSKEPPGTLIASDRSQCVVPVDQFEKTGVGQSISCVWSPPSGRP